MSRHAAVELAYGDGVYTFRLGLSEIEELEDKCSRMAGRDVGVFTLASMLSPARSARLGYIRETIRLGLIGGGTKPVDALAIVKRYLDERPLEESRDVAYAIVLAGLERVHGHKIEDRDEGEAQAAGQSASTSPPSKQAQPSSESPMSASSPSASGSP